MILLAEKAEPDVVSGVGCYPIGHGKCPNDVANHSAVLLPDLANYSVSFKPYLARGLQHTPYLTAEIRQDRISQLRL